jgi:hypothetical protein
MIGQVHGKPVEAVRNRRAGRTPCRVVGAEHEVVDEELRAPSEKVRKRSAPLVGLEAILLVDANPRQLLPSPRQFVLRRVSSFSASSNSTLALSRCSRVPVW